MAETATLAAIASHGASRLPSVELDSYNLELKDDEGFIGDRASKGAFREIIENWRKSLRKNGDDPFGEVRERRDFQEGARRAAVQGRSRGGGHPAGRDRGFLAGARAGDPALPQDQGLEGHRAHRGRRRLSRQPRRRAGDRPHHGDPQGRQGRRGPARDPQRSGRGRTDRRRASGAEMAVQGP